MERTFFITQKHSILTGKSVEASGEVEVTEGGRGKGKKKKKQKKLLFVNTMARAK